MHILARLLLPLVTLGFATIAAAQTSQPPQFSVCQGTYALCTTAVCTPKGDKLECGCTVNQGYSVGGGAQCPPPPQGMIVSRYFPITSFQTCLPAPTASRPWADCLNALCTPLPGNPTLATCTCNKVSGPNYQNAPSFPWLISTGQANPNLCNNSTIYSSATTLDSDGITKVFNDYVKANAPYPLSMPTALLPQP